MVEFPTEYPFKVRGGVDCDLDNAVVLMGCVASRCTAPSNQDVHAVRTFRDQPAALLEYDQLSPRVLESGMQCAWHPQLGVRPPRSVCVCGACAFVQMWSLGTILMGLLSFMVRAWQNVDEHIVCVELPPWHALWVQLEPVHADTKPAIGSMYSTDEEKRRFAKGTMEFNRSNKKFCELFPQLLTACEESATGAGAASPTSGGATGGAPADATTPATAVAADTVSTEGTPVSAAGDAGSGSSPAAALPDAPPGLPEAAKVLSS